MILVLLTRRVHALPVSYTHHPDDALISTFAFVRSCVSFILLPSCCCMLVNSFNLHCRHAEWVASSSSALSSSLPPPFYGGGNRTVELSNLLQVLYNNRWVGAETDCSTGAESLFRSGTGPEAETVLHTCRACVSPEVLPSSKINSRSYSQS